MARGEDGGEMAVECEEEVPSAAEEPELECAVVLEV